ncbi:hypothetical protein FPOAC2_07476 [Fusarium poae]|uniref:Apple domain-containing protein n=1 Tax=Fusarium poae TaxID=36050 RepID=A0A1B8AI36_FUSPO|nr:hypothetical protein FPOAC1_010108 [Fusarium poae]KAG8670675.1 hypothetical protein FPOAC1_010108 [Fusarium poae]OBS20225.1 hypothetical protein FPOA_06611 [Fusarium poae]
MVQAKIITVALAACFFESVYAGACKPRSSLSTEGQPISSTVASGASSIATETSTMAETFTTAETSTLAITTTSQFLEPSSTTSDSSTTTTAAPADPVCGQHGTCSPASDGCRSRIASNSALYLGECQDICRADANCKSIIYDTQNGNCFLNANIAQDSGFYQQSSPRVEWYDNACDIEKREPDPICGAYGECNQSKCQPMAVSGFYTAETCQQSCASDPNCGSFIFFPSFQGCYTLEKSLFKSGFYEKQTSIGLWFDRACNVQVAEPVKL